MAQFDGQPHTWLHFFLHGTNVQERVLLGQEAPGAGQTVSVRVSAYFHAVFLLGRRLGRPDFYLFQREEERSITAITDTVPLLVLREASQVTGGVTHPRIFTTLVNPGRMLSPSPPLDAPVLSQPVHV